MPGTKSGGVAARDTNRAKYGKDFYAKIGAIGGRTKYPDSPPKGFAADLNRAKWAGSKGGSISKRGPTKKLTDQPSFWQRLFKRKVVYER